MIRFFIAIFIVLTVLGFQLFDISAAKATRSKHFEDVEEARKKKQRSEEHSARSKRMVYDLHQQVKDIEIDIQTMLGHAPKRLKKVRQPFKTIPVY